MGNQARRWKILTTTAAFGLLLGSAVPGRAQSPVGLSLTSPVTAASVGSTITFTLNLIGGTNVGEYNTYVTLDGAYLSPVTLNTDGDPADDYYFTSTNSSFSFELANSPMSPSTDTQETFQVSAGSTRGITPAGTTSLGTFSVFVRSSLPVGGTALTLAAVTTTGFADNGYSDVLNFTTTANELTSVTGATLLPLASAPEPSGSLALLVGAALLGGIVLCATRRRTRA